MKLVEFGDVVVNILMENDNKLIGKGEESNLKPKCGNKITTEEFIRRAKEIHGDKYDYSESVYTNYETPVKIFCKACNEFFFQTPRAHLFQKSGCPRCAAKRRGEGNRCDTKTFIEKAKKIHGEKYDYSEVKYVDRNTPVKIYCKRCHSFFLQKPSNHLGTPPHGCPNCAVDRNSESRRKTTEEFISEAKEIYKDKYDYTNTVYTGATDRVEVKCNTCGTIFYPIAVEHIYNHRECPECTKRRIREERVLSLNDFITRSREIHGNKYDYSLVNYIDSNTKVEIICKQCGLHFFQKPSIHLGTDNRKGCGCPNCNDPTIGFNKTVERIQKRFGDRYELIKDSFVAFTKMATFIDHQNGDSEFQIIPSRLMGRKNTDDKLSFGEYCVKEWLTEKGFKFKLHEPLSDLIRNKKPVVVDFYLEYNNITYIIEYSGKQHYEFNDLHHKTRAVFMNQLIRDQRLRIKCRDKENKTLLEIPYTFKTEEMIFDYLERTLIKGEDPSHLVNCKSLIKR